MSSSNISNEIEEPPSCLFPVLSRTGREKTCPAGEGSLTAIPDAKATFPTGNEDGLCAFFGATWALVLHRFASAEEIAFMISRSRSQEGVISLVTASIRPNQPVTRLVSDCGSRIISPYINDQHRVNSGLVFSDSVDRAREIFRVNNCQIGLVIDLVGHTVSLWCESQIVCKQQASFMASAIGKAMHEVASNPTQNMQAVSLFHENHQTQIASWNSRNPISRPPATSIYELIQSFCRSQADALAISSWDGEVSYSQLDAWTGDLAAQLCGMAVKPNTVVALCFEKSLWAIIGMISVLRAGGAFVILDPSHPPAHRQLVLSQARPTVILTSPSQQGLFDQSIQIPVIPVTSASVSPSPISPELFEPVNDQQDPAFLVFTSGSSGTPKGCVWSHGSLAGMIPVGGKWPFDTTCNRIFQFSPFVFGTCMLEIFSAFLTGGVLCIASDHEWKNDLVGAINRAEPTGLVLPPSLAKAISPDMIPSVRMLAMGGEQLDATLLDRWADRVRLVQGYGMSENAGILIFQNNLTRDSDPQTVGQSPNGRLWIVNPDNYHQLAPIGTVGELLYEGPGVASKYLNHPEKSAETFIESPAWLQHFTTLSGQGRFLKTGDLARYNADGTINHLGRKDSQVKIRGQRVDLKEIELLLRPQLDANFDVFVELVRPRGSTPILAAFLFSKETDAQRNKSEDEHGFAAIPTSLPSRMEQMGVSLRSSLPVYMVPTIYLLLKTLPTTTTGKVNRRALRDQASALTRGELESLMHGQQTEDVLPPATSMEHRLVRLIAQTLQLESTNIQVNTSFLKLGGDSITAMTLVRKCQAERIVLTLQDIFQKPTIASLALCAQEKPGAEVSGVDKRSVFGLTGTQQRILSEEQSSTGWSVMIELRQPHTSSEVADAIKCLVTRNPMLRARFVVSENNEAHQTVMEAIEGSYLFQEHGITSADKMAGLQGTSHTMLNPDTGPVFAAHLVQNRSETQEIVLVAHSLILDSASWNVLLEDLDQLLSGNTLAGIKAPKFQEWYSMMHSGVNRGSMLQELSSEGWADGDHDWNLPVGNITYVPGESAHLDSEFSQHLLGDGLKSLGIQPCQVILVALVRSFSFVFPDRKPPSVAMELDGRDMAAPSLHLGHTVGCFDSLLVCRPRNLDRLTSLDLVRRIKDSSWLSITRDMAHSLPTLANVDIVLHNHIGKRCGSEYSQFITELTDSPQSHSTPSGLLELVARGNGIYDSIELSYTFSDALGTTEQLHTWFSQFQEQLTETITQLLQASSIFTLADFPSLSLNYGELKILETEDLRSMGITKRGDFDDAYPCSSIQEGILLAQAVNPSRYRVQAVWRASLSNDKEELCIEKLKQAWSAVLQRHPALRTVFVSHPRDPAKHIQLVLTPSKAGNEARVVGSFDDLVDKFPERNSSIAQMILQRLPSGEVECRLETDHTVIDGLSLQILTRDLALAYGGGLSSNIVSQFREHIMAQDNLPREESKTYWTGLLQNCNPCRFPDMNKDCAVSEQSARFRSMDIELGSPSRLFDLSHRHGLTMSTIFQVAWALVLQTFTGQDSVCFGYMVSGRESSLEGIWDAVGMFTNMITRVIDLKKETALLDILQATQQSFTDSLPHQQIAPAEVFERLGLASQHLFNTLVSFVNVVEDRSAEGNVKFEVTSMLDHSEYDVTLDGMMQDGIITARIKYWDSVLSDDQAQSVVGLFRQAIDVLAASSDRPISQIYLLSDKDKQQIMKLNKTPPAPIDSSIHAYVEEQARARPLAPAVHGWNGSFTYGELSSHSSSLAKHLSSLGVQPHTVIPLCFEKSCWTPVAMLAVLKAGGTFVMLNPSLPFQRLQSICHTIGAQTILTSKQNAALCADLALDRVVVVDEYEWIGDREIIDWAPPPVCGADMAYIVFTSGSTGAPKGAMIHHSAFLISALRYGPPLKMDRDARVLQFSSYSFDISVSDHLATLLTGGCICIPSDAELKADLSSAITDYRVNWAMITPSVSRILQPDSVPSLKTLCLIGEALTASDVRAWSKHVTLMNTYGPAETACVSHGCLSLTAEAESKCIGKGLGALSWIVDQNDTERLMPVGAVGELLIDGPIVGSGYLSNAEKTNAAFIDCPRWMNLFRPGHTGKLYKTGDLVRYMNDGSILFCGRKNTQVKVRGQWVELSEVESVSRQCFTGASHLVVENAEDPSILVGFVTWTQSKFDHNVSTNGLLLPATPHFQEQASLTRRRMLDLVPEFMVPTAFIPVHHIPLGPTGKADRHQLRDLLRTLSKEDILQYSVGKKESVMPSTGLEANLQRIYASVLGLPVETIGVDDDFFHLGGSSLAAMKISSRTRLEGLPVSFADVFKHRTIRQLALSVESDGVGSPLSVASEKDASTARQVLTEGLLASLSDMQIVKTDVENALPCTPMQTMMLRAQHQEPEIYTLCFSVQITSQSSSIDANKLQDAWKAVALRHTILRTVFVHTGYGDNYSQIVLTCEAASRFGDLSKLPYQLVFTQETPNTVTLTGKMNHALGDAASTAVILDELSRMYRNQSLEPPASDFDQYAQYIQTSSESSSRYWSEYLHNASPCLFPHQKTAIRGQLRTLHINISQEFQTISESCQQSKATIPTLIKAAWALTLALWVHTDSVCFGYLISGRDAPILYVETIVGPLVNLLVCRLDLESQPTLGHILNSIQEDYSQSLSHHPGTIPALHHVEQESSRPLFNTLLNHRQYHIADPNSFGDDDLNFRITSSSDPMHYDIVVVVDEMPNEIKLSLNYWDARVPESTVVKLASTFDAMLSLFITDKLLKPADVLRNTSLLD